MVQQAGPICDVGEGAVAVIVKQLRRKAVGIAARPLHATFVANEQVEVAVVVKVPPDPGLSGVGRSANPAFRVTSVKVPSPLLFSSELRI